MPAHVVISNNTRNALHVEGCLSLFGIALGNDTVHPEGFWNTCARLFTIPVGESTYAVTVDANYQTCGGEPEDHVPACGPTGAAPLPPGDYQAEFLQVHKIAEVPNPIPVHVTAPDFRTTAREIPQSDTCYPPPPPPGFDYVDNGCRVKRTAARQAVP
jgi:hypothetical protein